MHCKYCLSPMRFGEEVIRRSRTQIEVGPMAWEISC